MSSNKIKLHPDAIVDNINLINIVHDPSPIVFEKPINKNQTNYYRGSDYFDDTNRPKSSNNFEFIDVDKLSMYSYLVQREFKEKEWLNKFYQNENYTNEEPVKLPKQVNKIESKKSVAFLVKNKNEQVKSTESKSSISTEPSSKTKTSNNNSTNPLNKLIINKPESELAELVKCCDDSIKAIEFMEKKLNEFKNERLKIVFNNPNDEEKHKRIQLEQIKYLSRSTYNLQNQMAKFKSQLSQSHKSTSKTISPIIRLVHAMRQAIKLIHIFSSDLYPYRPDNNDPINDKLYLHFYKQLNILISNFNECINTICLNNVVKLNDQFNFDKSKIISEELINLLSNCDKFFDEFKDSSDSSSIDTNNINKVNGKYSDSNIKKSNSTNILNVIRVSRNNRKMAKQSNLSIDKKSCNKSDMSQKQVPISARSDSSSPTKVSTDYVQKKVKTARLIPERKNEPQKAPIKSILSNNKKIPLKSIENENMPSNPAFTNEWYSTEDLRNIKRLNDMNLLDKDKQEVAFEHLSSPKIKRLSLRARSDEKIHLPIKQKSNSRSRSNSSNLNMKTSNNNLNGSKTTSTSSIYLPSYSVPNEIEDLNISVDLEEMKLKYGNDFSQVKAKFNQTHNDNFKFDQEFATNLFKKQYNKPIDPNSTASFPQSTRKLISKLDLIKRDNDDIKKKYQDINYEFQSNILSQQPKRRYEELYLPNTKPLEMEYESNIDFNKIYKPLKEPSLEQLNRVVDYSKKFKEYNEKTSITTIGESKFDDFELFEMLSEDMYNKYFNSVYEELESLNEEIASSLINAEFQVSDKNYIADSSVKEEMPILTKKNYNITNVSDKNNASIHSHETGISIHTIYNDLDVQNNNQEENMPFNNSYSSFKTNQDESSSLTSYSN